MRLGGAGLYASINDLYVCISPRGSTGPVCFLANCNHMPQPCMDEGETCMPHSKLEMYAPGLATDEGADPYASTNHLYVCLSG
jgi:hypothetical protein